MSDPSYPDQLANAYSQGYTYDDISGHHEAAGMAPPPRPSLDQIWSATPTYDGVTAARNGTMFVQPSGTQTPSNLDQVLPAMNTEVAAAPSQGLRPAAGATFAMDPTGAPMPGILPEQAAPVVPGLYDPNNNPEGNWQVTAPVNQPAKEIQS